MDWAGSLLPRGGRHPMPPYRIPAFRYRDGGCERGVSWRCQAGAPRRPDGVIGTMRRPITIRRMPRSYLEGGQGGVMLFVSIAGCDQSIDGPC